MIDPQPVAPPGSEALLTILGWAMWIVIVICVAGAIAAVGRLAWAGWTGEPLANPVKGVLIPVVAAAMLGAIAGIVLAVI